MRIGTVREIWRYPVKSMMGERLERSVVDALGLLGDRAWAVRDEVRGGIRGAKKIPGLMTCGARFVEPPQRGAVGAPEIVLPHGGSVRADAPDAAVRVSQAVGTTVTLWPLLPADQKEHYRRGKPDHAKPLDELRAIFGRTEDEPLPNLAALPRELFEYESPPGTYFDAFPLLVLTTSSLAALAEVAPQSHVDVRRFRPNFVVETDPSLTGYIEAGFAGRRIRIGELEIQGTIACERCVMITHAFADLPRDPGLMRTVVKHANQSMGLYAKPVGTAEVSIGDPVELLG